MKFAALGIVGAVALTASAVATPAAAAPAPAAAPAAVPARTAPAAVTAAAPAEATTRVARPRRVSTKRLIIRAVTREVMDNGVAASQFTVERVRVSRVNPSWAAAALVPKRSADLDPADVLVRRTKSTWVVSDLGTAEVGCGVAPRRVLGSLGLRC